MSCIEGKGAWKTFTVLHKMLRYLFSIKKNVFFETEQIISLDAPKIGIVISNINKDPILFSAILISLRISIILGLDDYIREIFRQLDYKHTGSVTREDFTLLCEVLGLNTTPPTSKRNSGLEWLASYRPRPNSPGSPLRWKLYYIFFGLCCILCLVR